MFRGRRTSSSGLLEFSAFVAKSYPVDGSFAVPQDTTRGMLKDLPDGRLVVTETRIADAAEVNKMRDSGVHAFRVGEAFMRADDPGLALAALFGA